LVEAGLVVMVAELETRVEVGEALSTSPAMAGKVVSYPAPT
tara:strand:+ start:1037 stop:1159 length:123 start_codon:yes stop_codon:yes gene_type:complete